MKILKNLQHWFQKSFYQQSTVSIFQQTKYRDKEIIKECGSQEQKQEN